MPPARRDDESTFREFLAFHVGEINVVSIELLEQLVQRDVDGLGFDLPRDQADGVTQLGHGVDADFIDDTGFPSIFLGHNEIRDLRFRRCHRDGERAFRRSHSAIQREFAHADPALHLFRLKLPRGDQHAQGDGKVKAGGVFGEIRRGQVDDGAPGGTLVAKVGQGAFDAVNAFAHRCLGQADEHRFRQPRGSVDLDFDRHRVDADQGECRQFGEHEQAS